MQAKLAHAEANRTTLQARMHSDPTAVLDDVPVLEDETVDDNENDRVELEHEDSVHNDVETSRPLVQLEPPPDEPMLPDPVHVDEEDSVSVISSEAPSVAPVAEPPAPAAKPPKTYTQAAAPAPAPIPPPVPASETTVPLSTAPSTTVPPAPSSAAAPPSSAPEPAPTGAADDSVERQTLLRQLDLLRVKFRQSIIPNDIETQATAAVRSVVERNLVNLKRARNVAMHRRPLPCMWSPGAV